MVEFLHENESNKKSPQKIASQKNSLIEKAIEVVSPRWAVKREEDRQLLSYYRAYEGASPDRSVGGTTWTGGKQGDEDTVAAWDRLALTAEARDLVRNDAIASSLIRAMTDNVVGSGIHAIPQTSDKEWNEKTEAFLRSWEGICDVKGVNVWRDFCRQAISESIIAGDIGFLLTQDADTFPKVQMVEGELITNNADTKDAIGGVKVNKNGTPVGFYLGRRNGGRVQNDKLTFVRREDFVLLARRYRPDQLRGISQFAPVIQLLRQFKQYNKATLTKADMQSRFAWAFYRDQALTPASMGPRLTGTVAQAAEDGKIYERIENGMVIYPRRGEKIEMLAPNTPGSTHDKFTEQLIRMMAACLGLPYEFVMMDSSKANFSASKAILVQAQRTFECWQKWLEDYLLRRVYGYVVSKAVKLGYLPAAPADWYRVQFMFPSVEWLDPNDAATADQMKYAISTTSLTQIAKRKGQEVDDIMREKAKEIEMAIRMADEISKSTGVKVEWFNIISPPAGSPVSFQALNSAQDEQPMDRNQQIDNNDNGDENAK